MGSERAIEDGSGAPNSLLARASVGTEDERRGVRGGGGASRRRGGKRRGEESVLTLLGLRGAGRDFLVGVDGGFRGQTVELFAADQVDLLEVLHLLLQRE